MNYHYDAFMAAEEAPAALRPASIFRPPAGRPSTGCSRNAQLRTTGIGPTERFTYWLLALLWRTWFRDSGWTPVRKSVKNVSMSAIDLKSPYSPAEEPYEEVLKILLADWRAYGICSQSDRALILALAAKISPARRTVLLQGFERELKRCSSRGGPVFQNVVRRAGDIFAAKAKMSAGIEAE